jgi:hypothetical protein
MTRCVVDVTLLPLFWPCLHYGEAWNVLIHSPMKPSV